MRPGVGLVPFPFFQAVTLSTPKQRVIEKWPRRIFVAKELQAVQLAHAASDRKVGSSFCTFHFEFAHRSLGETVTPRIRLASLLTLVIQESTKVSGPLPKRFWRKEGQDADVVRNRPSPLREELKKCNGNAGMDTESKEIFLVIAVELLFYRLQERFGGKSSPNAMGVN
jgi:hypothetical protein